MYIFDNLLDRSVSVALDESGDGSFIRRFGKLSALCVMRLEYRGRNRTIENRRRGVLTEKII